MSKTYSFAYGVDRVLEEAEKFRQTYNSKSITTGHILLALSSLDFQAGTVLKNLGIKKETVLNTLQSAYASEYSQKFSVYHPPTEQCYQIKATSAGDAATKVSQAFTNLKQKMVEELNG